jgi:NAD(P)H-hydrate repair Nnr-like enzyme with NAD(P)H-hydrate dehydratase domain
VTDPSMSDVVSHAARVIETLQGLRPSAVVVGPGLGRHPLTMRVSALVLASLNAAEPPLNVAAILNSKYPAAVDPEEVAAASASALLPAKLKHPVPVVVDADALYCAGMFPRALLGSTHAIITPNAMEASRLWGRFVKEQDWPTAVASAMPSTAVSAATLSERLDGVGVLLKGERDEFHQHRAPPLHASCELPGSPRRCGGQGDLLAGAVATFSSWAERTAPDAPPYDVAVEMASASVRRAAAQAFRKRSFGTLTTDILAELAFK